MNMRWAIFAAGLAAAGYSEAGAALAEVKPPGAETVQASDTETAQRPTAQQLRLTSPPNAAADRTYAKPEDALLAADVDYLVQQGRRAIRDRDAAPFWYTAVFADDLASNRLSDARATLNASPGGANGGLSNMLEPFLLAAEGQVDRGVERIDAGEDNLPAPLPEVARGLLFEGAGRLQEAAAVYGQMVERLDLTPPGDAEPQTPEEYQRALGAARVTHALYRAALVNHRLGRRDEARRLYAAVAAFAPRSADVVENMRRLEAGQPPLEAALDVKSAAGRWMLFLSEYVTQTEALRAIVTQRDPTPGFDSFAGAVLLQLGVLLSPDANDWRLYAAEQTLEAGGKDGAQRIIDQMPAGSVFAPDAEIVRAEIALDRQDDASAVAAAERALAAAGERWSVIGAAGDVYRRVGQAERAIPAYDRALALVSAPKDRARVLGWRAYARRFGGDVAAASADMRAAYALDQGVDTRLLYVSILMDDPQGWRDGVEVARGLFAEQPDSVLRLNALGYALIQRPEGLEEGYRLLWRGFNYGQTDYAVVDSLGWAYYQYGRFEEARALIERANALSAQNPNFEVLDHSGDVYWRLGRRDDARRAWRDALAARPDALRRRSIQAKLDHGLTTPAPRRQALPEVNLPDAPSRRDTL